MIGRLFVGLLVVLGSVFFLTLLLMGVFAVVNQIGDWRADQRDRKSIRQRGRLAEALRRPE
jgi:hypothetical protein